MQRLRGSDAFTIYAESAASPFVTMKVAIYKPVADDDTPGTSEIRHFVKVAINSSRAERAGLRIMRVPFDLHHPVWVADPGFSPDDHIYCARLPPPGSKAELCDFLSELMGKPLNPERPLWEIWLVEGLDHGKVAIVFKVHHALADGKTLATLIERGHSTAIAEKVIAAGSEGEAIPGKSRLILDALVDLARSYTVEFPRYYRHLKHSRQGSAALGGDVTGIVAPFSAPHTLLNDRGGRDRIYRYETFSLADFKSLAKIFECSINVLVLGVCSEALGRYMAELDTLPSESLVAVMPVGDPGEGELKTLLNSSIHNNHLAVAIVPLYQNIDDFSQRLRAIKRASRVAVDNVVRSNGRRFDNYLDFMPGTFVRLVNALMVRRQTRKQNPFANVAISNVVGPRERLHALGGRLEMVELLSAGNLTDSVNLNITVWSYVGNLCFSLYSRQGVLPEPEKINSGLSNVVEELRRQYLADAVSITH